MPKTPNPPSPSFFARTQWLELSYPRIQTKSHHNYSIHVKLAVSPPGPKLVAKCGEPTAKRNRTGDVAPTRAHRIGEICTGVSGYNCRYTAAVATVTSPRSVAAYLPPPPITSNFPSSPFPSSLLGPHLPPSHLNAITVTIINTHRHQYHPPPLPSSPSHIHTPSVSSSKFVYFTTSRPRVLHAPIYQNTRKRFRKPCNTAAIIGRTPVLSKPENPEKLATEEPGH